MAGESEANHLEEGEIFQFYDAEKDVVLLIKTLADGKLRFEYRGHLWASVEMSKPVVNRLIRLLEEWRK